MLCISWITRRTNDSVLQEVQTKTRLLSLIQSQMLSYFGHITRGDGDCLEKVIMQGQVEGSRKPGRPRTRWIDQNKLSGQIKFSSRSLFSCWGSSEIVCHCWRHELSVMMGLKQPHVVIIQWKWMNRTLFSGLTPRSLESISIHFLVILQLFIWVGNGANQEERKQSRVTAKVSLPYLLKIIINEHNCLQLIV